MYVSESVKTYGLIALIIVGSFWFASRFIEPPPPTQFILAAGSADGDYFRYAEAYKKALAKDGVNVEILETAGSSENAALLSSGKADVAFIQSGLRSENNADVIESLGSLYYEPLWVFSRKAVKEQKDLQSLGKGTFAIGPEGSGTRAISEQLLKVNGLEQARVNLSDLSGEDAAEALLDGRLDAAFFIARLNVPYIKTLLRSESVHLLSFNRAEAYTRNLPFLSEVVLSEGVVDIADNVPARDVTLLSPVAQLTVKEDFNGALKTLLVRAAMDIHKKPDVFSEKGQFPTLDYADFNAAEEAERYFVYGPNVLLRVMPFWLADMIGRMVVMLIPLLGVMLPLIKIASPTYRWRTRSRIYKWYKKLKSMEASAVEDNREDVLKSLESIDEDVKKTIVPLSYTDELYNLRQHIQLIKHRLEQK